jgi:hypothetical protein
VLARRGADNFRFVALNYAYMIPSAFLYFIGLLLNLVNYILPNWTLWPAKVERGFQLVGQYAYWLDPWVPMADFWGAILYLAAFILALLPFVIFSRSFRIKLFRE